MFKKKEIPLEISMEEFMKLDFRKEMIIDIREEEEWMKWCIQGVILKPKWELIKFLDNFFSIPFPYKGKTIYLICEHWNRSAFMTNVLRAKWYNAVNVLWWMKEYNLKKKPMKIIKFYMTGCNPCMSLNEVLKDKEFKDLDIEEREISNPLKQMEAIEDYILTDIPTLIFYREEKEVDRLSWYITKEWILNVIKN